MAKNFDLRFTFQVTASGAAKRVQVLRQELDKLGLAANKASQALKGQGPAAQRFAQETQKVGQAAAVTGQSLTTMGRRAKGAGDNLAKTGAAAFAANQALLVLNRVNQAASAVLDRVTTSGGNFQKKMSELSTLVARDAAPTIERFTKTIDELRSALPLTGDDLGAAAYQVVSAGIEGLTRQTVTLEAASKLAVGGLGSVSQATDILTSSVNAFNLNADEAVRAANTLFLAVQGGKTTVAELSQAFGGVATVASQAGASIDEVAAATAALTTTGLKTAEAQQNLRQTIVALIAPNTKMLELFEKMGVASGQQLIAQRGLVGAIQAVTDATEGNSKVLKEALGRVQALSVAYAFAGIPGEKYSKILRTMTNDQDALSFAVREAIDNFQDQGVILSNEVDKLAETVFNATSDMLEGFERLSAGLVRVGNEALKTVPQLDTVAGTLVVGASVTAKASTALAGFLTQFALINLVGPSFKKFLIDAAKDLAGFIALLKISTTSIQRFFIAVQLGTILTQVTLGLTGLAGVAITVAAAIDGLNRVFGDGQSNLLGKLFQAVGLSHDLTEESKGLRGNIDELTGSVDKLKEAFDRLGELRKNPLQDLAEIAGTVNDDFVGPVIPRLQDIVPADFVGPIKPVAIEFPIAKTSAAIQEIQKVIKEGEKALEEFVDKTPAEAAIGMDAFVETYKDGLLNAIGFFEEFGGDAAAILDLLGVDLESLGEDFQNFLSQLGDDRVAALQSRIIPSDFLEEQIKAIEDANKVFEALFDARESVAKLEFDQLNRRVKTDDDLIANQQELLRLATELDNVDRERAAQFLGLLRDQEAVIRERISRMENADVVLETFNLMLQETEARSKAVGENWTTVSNRIAAAEERAGKLSNAIQAAQQPFQNLIEAARTEQQIAELQLEAALKHGVSYEDRINLLANIDASERVVLELMKKEALAALQVAKIRAESDPEASGLVRKLEAEIRLLEEQLKEAGQRVQEFAEGIEVSLGDAFVDGIEAAFDAVVNGTRKMKDVFKGLKESIIGSFAKAFAESIKEKLGFDAKLQVNARDIIDLFKGVGSGIFDAFKGAFSSVAGLFGSGGQATGAVSSAGAGAAGAAGASAAEAAGAAGAGSSATTAAAGAGAGAAAAGIGAAGWVAIFLIAGSVLAKVTPGIFRSIFGFTGERAESSGRFLRSTFDPAGATFSGELFSKEGLLSVVTSAIFGIFGGGVLGNLFLKVIKFSTIRNEFEKGLRDSLTNALVGDVIPEEVVRDRRGSGNIVSKKALTQRDLVREGRPASNLAQVLALLASADIKSPFDDRPVGKVFGEFAGKIQDIFNTFPEFADEAAKELLNRFGGSLVESINTVQAQLLKVVDEFRGRDKLGRTFAEEQQAALEELVETGYIIPLETAVKEIIQLYSEDLPRAVRNSLDRIIDDAFERARRSPEGRVAAKENRVVTADGEAIARALEIEIEAFRGLAEAIATGAATLLEGGSTEEALSQIGLTMRDIITQRASEGLTGAFLAQADFQNLLSPLFFTLERGLDKILNAKTAEDAAKFTQRLIRDLNKQTEAVSQNLEALAPVVEAYAELQEDLAAALTSFAQAAEQTRQVLEKIDLTIAELTGNTEFLQSVKVKQAGENEARATRRFFETLTGGGQGRNLARTLRRLSDVELKKLPGQLDAVADAIIQNANIQIAALQEELRLAQQWAGILAQTKDVLNQVSTFGRTAGQAETQTFEFQRNRLADLIRTFESGNDQERFSAAQQILQLAPQLLSAAEAAGFLPGSSAFEVIRSTLEAVLLEIQGEGETAEDRAIKIQQEIKAVQEEAVAKLEQLRIFGEAIEAELTRRGINLEDIDTNTGVDGTSGKVLEAAERTALLLERGINVFNVGTAKGQEDPFGPLVTGSAQFGGIFTRPEGLVQLHGPEAIIPLDRLPEVITQIQESPGDGGNRCVQVNLDARIERYPDDDPSELAEKRRFKRMFLNAIRDGRVQKELKDMVGG